VIFVTPYFIHLIFNGKYDPSIQYFPFLAIGWSLRMMSQLQTGAVFGLGKIKYNLYSSLITLLFNVLIISISIFYFGLIGAAYSSVFGGLVYVLTSRYFFNKAKHEMIESN